ncbi:MAG: hypothetical protein ACTSU2_13485 [Promethearchaeota archaeon]
MDESENGDNEPVKKSERDEKEMDDFLIDESKYEIVINGQRISLDPEDYDNIIEAVQGLLESIPGMQAKYARYISYMRQQREFIKKITPEEDRRKTLLSIYSRILEELEKEIEEPDEFGERFRKILTLTMAREELTNTMKRKEYREVNLNKEAPESVVKDEAVRNEATDGNKIEILENEYNEDKNGPNEEEHADETNKNTENKEDNMNPENSKDDEG